MKYLIILADGMADHAIRRLNGMTPLQYAQTPWMDRLACEGQCGRLLTIPEGFTPGSEVANTAILGYDLKRVYEGRGPLEAASIGYDMQPGDLALRCNIVTLDDGRIQNHHGGHLTTAEGRMLIDYLNSHLADHRVKFIPGIQYRHLLIIKGGSKHIVCAPPHDHPGEPWRPLLVKPDNVNANNPSSFILHPSSENAPLNSEGTAALLNNLILRSQELLEKHPFNQGREHPANSIWPWSGGYRPQMETLTSRFPQIKSGAVITAVDLIRGIGRYAGLDVINVDGATGLSDTNYEGKAQAAIDALQRHDFVFLHIEASDEAGHDGDLQLKLQTIEDLDRRVVRPIMQTVSTWQQPVTIALLPDHPTPVEQRIHVAEPVPFAIWNKTLPPDNVQTFDEVACVGGTFGLLQPQQFIQKLMEIV